MRSLPVAAAMLLLVVSGCQRPEPVAPCSCPAPDSAVSDEIHAAHRRINDLSARMEAEVAKERAARTREVAEEQRVRKQFVASGYAAMDMLRNDVLRDRERTARRLDALERRIAILERKPAPAPTPVPPAPPVPPGPVWEWRTIGDADYYGYQDGDVFRYSEIRFPYSDCTLP